MMYAQSLFAKVTQSRSCVALSKVEKAKFKLSIVRSGAFKLRKSPERRPTVRI